MKDKTVAILESRARDHIAGLVRKRGGTPFLAPALAEIPDVDPAHIHELIRDWNSTPPETFIFQTGAGARALFAATDLLGLTGVLLPILDAAQVIVRGPKPAMVLRSRKVRIDRAASDPFTTHEVLVEMHDIPLRGKRVVVQRYGETNRDLQAELESEGADVTDATDAGVVEAAVEKTVATFGRLDVLVNNAGTAVAKRFEETSLKELDRLIGVNVRGVFVATQAALKHMKSGGRIISIGSAVGERALTPGLVPYSATKGAVKMFTQGLSREVASRGITVNNVQPGPIDTDANPAAGEWAVPQKAFTALDRYGHVDEVAALVAFVAGPESSYITGANLTVDGGMIA
jgi:3-oxoacyl-[acyl-carrier protein] reductase